MLVFLCLVLSAVIAQGRVREDPLVQTDKGLIRGLRADDGDYFMFLGIPYGIVDKNKPFGISIPSPKFDEVYEAFDDSAVCPQMDEDSNFMGTLDCLHLNVYVPFKANSRNTLPVLVWIHGGAYDHGCAGRYLYGSKYLVRHGVIIVTLNYRVGPYGFLCFGTPVVPGNQGLKDQLLALRWIKSNIASFGGDVNDITIMGESAGGASVDVHLRSKQEKLFNKAIIQSSTLFKPNGISDMDETPAFQIAETLGFYTQNISEAMSFLEQTDPNLVVEAYKQRSLILRVCVEKELDDVESIITEHPLNLNIPKIKGMSILAGFTSKEGIFNDYSYPSDYFKRANYFSDTLQFTFNADEDFRIYEDIARRFYVGEEEMTEELRENIIDFESDFYFNYPIQSTLPKYLDNGANNVFQYLFSYDGGLNLKLKQNITIKSASHADELGYLFDVSYTKQPSEEDQLKFLLLTLLVAFAAADVSHIVGKTGEASAKILKQELDVGVEGQYQWAIETDNGISARAQGGPKSVPGSDVPAEVVQGEAKWTAPGGEVVEIIYSADENGYQAQGPYIPTPPPIPEAILRSLEWIRAHPPKEQRK